MANSVSRPSPGRLAFVHRACALAVQATLGLAMVVALVSSEAFRGSEARAYASVLSAVAGEVSSVGPQLRSGGEATVSMTFANSALGPLLFLGCLVVLSLVPATTSLARALGGGVLAAALIGVLTCVRVGMELWLASPTRASDWSRLDDLVGLVPALAIALAAAFVFGMCAFYPGRTR